VRGCNHNSRLRQLRTVHVLPRIQHTYIACINRCLCLFSSYSVDSSKTKFPVNKYPVFVSRTALPVGMLDVMYDPSWD